MTLREFYLERRRAEFPIFMKVLNALPADRLDYKPHDRSPSAEQIVRTMTMELQACVDAATKRRAEWTPAPPRPFREMLDLFQQWYGELTDAVSKMDDASWDQTAQFFYGGKMVSEQPISQFLWFIHFDAIHHRGQLTTYLRPMGGTVPAVYGPSADSRT